MTDTPVRGTYLPFTTPDMTDLEINEVADSMRSGWLTTGPKVQKFSQKLAEYVGAKYAVSLNSATAGLHIAYLAAGLKPGDKILTSPLTFVATANTAIHCGAGVRFADIDIDTLNINPSAAEAAFKDDVKILVPVHFAGLPCDMDPLLALAKKHGALVVEDAAHSVGAEYKGRRLGTFGNMTVFSFHPNKNMTTGEGGAVTFNDEKYKSTLEILSFHGIDKNAWKRQADRSPADYDVEMPGFKYNMLDLQAAIGLHQLDRLDGFNTRRAAIAARYNEAFAGIDELHLPKSPAHYAHRHVWHLYTPLLKIEKLGVTRNEFMDLLKAQNIGSGYHYRAIHLHPLFQRMGFKKGMFPNAEYASERILSLPLFPKMKDADVEDSIKGVKKVIAALLAKRK